MSRVSGFPSPTDCGLCPTNVKAFPLPGSHRLYSYLITLNSVLYPGAISALLHAGNKQSVSYSALKHQLQQGNVPHRCGPVVQTVIATTAFVALQVNFSYPGGGSHYSQSISK